MVHVLIRYLPTDLLASIAHINRADIGQMGCYGALRRSKHAPSPRAAHHPTDRRSGDDVALYVAAYNAEDRRPHLPNPQTGNPRSVNRWGVVALLVLSAALVAASLDVASSVRSLLLAAMVMGVLVGPVVSRCLGTPSLELHDSRAERP